MQQPAAEQIAGDVGGDDEGHERAGQELAEPAGDQQRRQERGDAEVVRRVGGEGERQQPGAPRSLPGDNDGKGGDPRR